VGRGKKRKKGGEKGGPERRSEPFLGGHWPALKRGGKKSENHPEIDGKFVLSSTEKRKKRKNSKRKGGKRKGGKRAPRRSR